MSSTAETPLEIARRIRVQQDHEANERAKRQEREREMEARASTYVPPKDPSQMAPADLEARRYQQAERERKEEVEARERQLWYRIKNAFLDSGGHEAEFEEQYPALRKRYISAQTMDKLQG